MVNLNLDGSAMVDKVSSTAKDLHWLLGVGGFMFGVTEKYRAQNTASGDKFYPFSTNGIADTVGQLAGNSTAKTLFPSWTGGASQTFNLGAIFNKWTGYAIVVAGVKEVWPNKYTRLIYNVAFPFLAGAGIGRVFDDPIAGSQSLTTPRGNAYPVANYSAMARNGLPVSAAGPWTQ